MIYLQTVGWRRQREPEPAAGDDDTHRRASQGVQHPPAGTPDEGWPAQVSYLQGLQHQPLGSPRGNRLRGHDVWVNSYGELCDIKENTVGNNLRNKFN